MVLFEILFEGVEHEGLVLLNFYVVVFPVVVFVIVGFLLILEGNEHLFGMERGYKDFRLDRLRVLLQLCVRDLHVVARQGRRLLLVRLTVLPPPAQFLHSEKYF